MSDYLTTKINTIYGDLCILTDNVSILKDRPEDLEKLSSISSKINFLMHHFTSLSVEDAIDSMVEIAEPCIPLRRDIYSLIEMIEERLEEYEEEFDDY